MRAMRRSLSLSRPSSPQQHLDTHFESLPKNATYGTHFLICYTQVHPQGHGQKSSCPRLGWKVALPL
jgi:hypothetical protein